MPDWGPHIRARLASLSIAPTREAEIIEELSQHLDDRWREIVAGGADADAAIAQTLAELRDDGRLAHYLSPLRQAHWADPTPPTPRGWYVFGGVTADVRDAIRVLRATPAFTSVALVVLALGIGATTAIFSVVDAVVLRPLPFSEPHRLVAVGERQGAGRGGAKVPSGMASSPGDPMALSSGQPQNYLDWVAQQTVFDSLAATASGFFTLHLPDGPPEDVVVQRVTASFFDVLRIRPAMGRPFTADNEIDGRHRVAVLSDAFWRRRLGARPDIVGQRILLDDGQFDVVGVLPPGVTYPVGAVRPTELWVPYVMAPRERIRGRGHNVYLQSIARLKAGVSLGQAQANLEQIAANVNRAFPGWLARRTFGVRPLQDHLVGASMRSWMLMLLSAVAIVLLIACANVANLLLARVSTRDREVAVRAALGAGRWRLVRQFLVESLLLSVVGTMLAIALAWFVVGVLRHAMPEGVPRVTTIALDFRVLGCAAALSILTGLVFGLAPALQASKTNLLTSLQDSARGASAGRGRQRLRGALMVAELASAVVLLVGAGLFIGSFAALMRVDPGFNPERVLTLQISARQGPGQPERDFASAFAQVIDRLRQTPGVARASAVSPATPLRPWSWIDGLSIPGRTIEGDTGVSIKVATPEYFQTLGISLERGRLFDGGDRANAPRVVILSATAARTFFRDENPVGRTVTLDNADRTVAGVVADVRQGRLEAAPQAEVYLPMAQATASDGFLAIKSAGDPYEILPAVKAVLADALPDAPARAIATMDELVAQQMAQRRLNMLMLALFGLLGLTISAVGIYGLMAYLVSQRTREIGIRMALGATRAQVIGMVMAGTSALVALGLAIGSVAAWYLGATAKTFLFGLEPHDSRTFLAAVIVLALAALVAAMIPARRAASVDPTIALRAE